MNIIAEAFEDTEQKEPVTIAGTFQERIGEFATLLNQKMMHAGEIDAIDARIKELEPGLLDDMAESGIDNIRAAGRTIYKRRDFYVSKRGEFSTEQIVEELRQHGLGYLVSEGYNAQSLKSVIKEWLEEQKDIPAPLAEKLNIGETIKLASRK